MRSNNLGDLRSQLRKFVSIYNKDKRLYVRICREVSIDLRSSIYLVMELLPDGPEQLCNTQLVRCWVVSKLAFLYQLSVFVICHRRLDKGTRFASVASSRFTRTYGSRRRIGAVLPEYFVWCEDLDDRRSTSAA
jgi:hypothetical protein